jgi:ferritin-like metal-binding protein YciE
MAQTQQDVLVAWLKDAYAMESSLVGALENHAKDADKMPHIQNKIRDHAEATRRHAEMGKDCIERLGGSVSAVKTAIGNIGGFIHNMGSSMAKDEPVKNALNDIATEHFEIACYRALIDAARALGDEETVRVCEEIVRDEEDMARFLEQNLSSVVQGYLSMQTA